MEYTLSRLCFGYIPCYASEASAVSDGAAVAKADGLASHVREGLRVASVPAACNSCALAIVHNVMQLGVRLRNEADAKVLL